MKIMATTRREDVTVVGAGIVGIATALALQAEGRDVLLLDGGPPGALTSHGNTGVLVEHPWSGINGPGFLRRLPGQLIGRSPGVRIPIGFAVRNISLLSKLIEGSEACAKGTMALHRLLLTSQAIHRRWIAEADASDLLRETGWLKVFRTPRGRAAYNADLILLGQSGTGHTVLNGADVWDLEPALGRGLDGGIWLNRACSLSSPRELSLRYLAHFQRRGGRFRKVNVNGLSPSADGWTLHHDDGLIAAAQVVIAAGPHSADLLRPLGYQIPMYFQRGYHLHLWPGAGPALRRPVHDIEGGYVMSPQEQGVRVTSGVEVNDRDAAPNRAQVDQAAASARRLANLGPAIEDTPWLGSRPTLPDGMPMIGPAPKHYGLWFNFGHHHIGLSLSAGSGDLLARMLTKQSVSPDADAFAPARYGGPKITHQDDQPCT
jgi:D-amino-acid dehydrogenase